jgi:hypothetical protein
LLDLRSYVHEIKERCLEKLENSSKIWKKPALAIEVAKETTGILGSAIERYIREKNL